MYLEFNNFFVQNSENVMNTEAMLDDLSRKYKIYRDKKAEVKQRLIEDLKDKKARGWNDTTITLDDLGVLLEEETCLHCEKGVAAYCEECFQKLIAENLKLQRK